ncbi:MAG: dihydrodipicolinate synthase family protein [Gemmatimonadota bacterium]|nr:dihydrodipicolinate synthase family protein [Gemmatimonadota bacterium]
MKTTPVTPRDLAASVIAVPPLARHADLTLDRDANRAMIRYLEDGGVSSLLYGGNANLYNVSLAEYPDLLDLLEREAATDSWVIPSVGPDFGKMMDQAELLRSRDFPTVMILPLVFPSTDVGLATGVRHFAERYGKPVMIYIKSDNYIEPATVAALAADGLVSAVKYGTVRKDPSVDPYLRALLDVVDPNLVISGIGERPAIIHLRDFGLKAFTSGSVCIAPRSSMRLLQLLTDNRYDEAEEERAAFLPLEDCRDEFSPIRVLHEAVTLADIANMGPMLPMLSNLSAAHRDRVGDAARILRQHDQRHAIA